MTRYDRVRPEEDGRYIVWAQRVAGWRLEGASHHPAVSGGHRALHELAVAIAATGRRVQMRGHVDLDELDVLYEATGVRPELPAEPLRPQRGDVVLMAEGSADPLDFAYVAFSGARPILLLLAPTGLIGWPFTEGWSRRSPRDVEIDSVCRPEHFQAMVALGFELWVQVQAMADVAAAAGVACELIGTGRPVPYPDPPAKRYDVVTLSNNRWAEDARAVASRLDPSVVHHEIPAGSNAEILEAVGQAFVLVHPLRIEGVSRIAQEARAMGTVPVVLGTSPYSLGLDDAGGSVAVPTLDEMPRAVMDLLSDPERLGRLRERGMRAARAQVDWDTYVGRVDAALSHAPAESPGHSACAVIGDLLMKREDDLGERASEAEALRPEVDHLRLEVARLREELSEAAAQRQILVQALTAEQDRVHMLKRTRAMRLAGSYWRTRERATQTSRRLSAGLQLFRDPRSFPREVPPAEREHPGD